MPTWKRLAREPLVHFLAIGAALFVFFAWRGGGAAPSRIVVTPGRIDHLVAGFTRTWQRPPDGDELKALVDEYVREEIAAREAQAMGLDADDTIIRRRLRQKLEFVVEDAAAAAPLTDQELERYLADHPEKFELEPRVSLRQVYVSRDRRGEAAEADATGILDRLRALGPDAGIDQVGDSLMVPQEIDLASRSEVARLFGDAFAEAVLELEPGVWSGPIESGYGPHLVLVRERTEAAMPDLAAVRQQVERELFDSRRREQLDAMYAKLLEKYTVVIESEENGDGATTEGGG
jgi:hypothetical protein